MGRKNGFLRIKNKYEPVYKAPACFRNAVGTISVSESGIFYTDGGYSKVYPASGAGDSAMTQAVETGTERGADAGLLSVKEDDWLLLYIQKNSMQEAQEWFMETERKGFLPCLSAEERLAGYARFSSAFLGTACSTDRYLAEECRWKAQAGMEGIRADGDFIKTQAGVCQAVAVRKFVKDPCMEAVRELTRQKAVMAAYTELSHTKDQTVADWIKSEYLGFDGILPRMKRNGPLLYGVLNGAEGNRESFVTAAAYYLLSAASPAELLKEREAFLETAGSFGIRAEAVPDARAGSLRRMKEAAAVFGMTGRRPRGYQSLIPSDAAWHPVLKGAPEAGRKTETYDMEEMREIFFETNGKTERNIQTEDLSGFKTGGPAF